MPTGITVQQFITGMEVVPGDESVVHHVLVFEDTTSTPLLLDAQDPNPGYISFGGTGSNASTLLVFVTSSMPARCYKSTTRSYLFSLNNRLSIV